MDDLTLCITNDLASIRAALTSASGSSVTSVLAEKFSEGLAPSDDRGALSNRVETGCDRRSSGLSIEKKLCRWYVGRLGVGWRCCSSLVKEAHDDEAVGGSSSLRRGDGDGGILTSSGDAAASLPVAGVVD